LALCGFSALALFAYLPGCALFAAGATVVGVALGVNALAFATYLPGGALDAAAASALFGYTLALFACLSGLALVVTHAAIVEVGLDVNALAVATVRLVGGTGHAFGAALA